jgi:hypothetical protein
VAVAAWIIMVPVDGENRRGYVDVGVLIVDMGKRALEDLGGVAQKFELTGLHSETVLPERTHDLVHGLARRFVVVEQVTTEEDHIDITSAGELHDLIKSAPTVILANGVSLFKPDMVIG